MARLFNGCGVALVLVFCFAHDTHVGDAIVKTAKSSTVVPDKHIGEAIVHKAKSFTVLSRAYTYG